MISTLQTELDRLFKLVSEKELKSNRALRIKTGLVRKKLLYLKSLLTQKKKENPR